MFIYKQKKICSKPTCTHNLLKDVFKPSYLNLTYPELLRKCAEVDITLSDADLELIEKDTRTQARGTAFFRHRAGHIGALSSWAASHTKPAIPSQSLIKSKQSSTVAEMKLLQLMHMQKSCHRLTETSKSNTVG